MQIHHFRHVGLTATDLPASADFYARVWGLDPVAGDHDAAYLGGDTSEHHVLELHRGDRLGLDHLAMALRTDEEVDAAADSIQRAGHRLICDPSPIARPGGGYGFRLVDPDGRVVELSAGVEERRPPDSSGDGRVRPSKVSHVVLNTPDIDRAHDFYTGVLGMRVSDWSEHQMVFLRCNREHHNIAFNQAEWASVNHVAFEVPDIDAVMRGIGGMRRAGREPLWGPGRHGPGNMVFCYFQDPSGYVIEYTSEVLRIDEDTWEPRIWERRPELMDLWGTSGPPRPEARRAMAGQPDPSFDG